MRKNNSPWISELRGDRICQGLKKDIETDIVIIGAGIAGVSTAFFVLKNTDKVVTLVDGYKLAHGATGHNAGQVVSYFERGFSSLVDEFGLELATDGQKNIEDAWELLDEMYTDGGLNIPFSRFLGHAGLSSEDQVLLHLKNNYFRKKGGLNTERILICDSVPFLRNIPEEYKELFILASHEEILSILETKIEEYIAVVSYQKGCINSALFCEEVVGYLIKKYESRFTLYEHTYINKIILKQNQAILDASNHTILSEYVILCTNGFETFTIINEKGLDINTKYHHLVHGTIGYMSGYVEKINKPPIAISYLTDPDSSTDDPYFYFTRRLYEYKGDKDLNLISIGGPEIFLDQKTIYSHEDDYPEEMAETLDNFIKKTYDPEPNKKIDYIFTWHGLMGYTKNGVRLIGPEPKNKNLMYNLGCNGVGILPSVYGGKKISDFIAGKNLGRSIFDVPKEYFE